MNDQCVKCGDKYGRASNVAGVYNTRLCDDCSTNISNWMRGLEEYRNLLLARDRIEQSIHIKACAGYLDSRVDEYWKLANLVTKKIIEYLSAKKETE